MRWGDVTVLTYGSQNAKILSMPPKRAGLPCPDIGPARYGRSTSRVGFLHVRFTPESGHVRRN
jgi:hypothetical protein